MAATDPIRCIIVDDEAHARELLREYAVAHTEIEIVGSYGDPIAAVEAIGHLEPELIFLDVEMPRLNGFELLASLDWDHLPAVVFTTAYDEHAVRAFEVSAVDYLLKPFHEERFGEAVGRAATAVRSGRAERGEHRQPGEEHLRRLLQSMRGSESLRAARIAVRAGHRIRLLPIDTIDFIESEGNYIRIHSGSESYLMRETLSGFHQRLDPGSFARVHRKHIVNVHRVVELEPLFKGEYVLGLRGGRRVTTGRTYRDHIREIFELGDSRS